MYELIIGFLTILLILNALFLLLVVLMQLPRKEAGLGVAFGGSAAEALFGAGTGTVLTKATTYGTITFLLLCLILSLLYVRGAYGSRTEVLEQLSTEEREVPSPLVAPTNLPNISTQAQPERSTIPMNVNGAVQQSGSTNLTAPEQQSTPAGKEQQQPAGNRSSAEEQQPASPQPAAPPQTPPSPSGQ